MAQPELTAELALLEEAITILFCEVDDAHLNPKGHHYASLKRLSDSEVITLALFQQLRATDSERRFLARGRSLVRFFHHLFAGMVELHPSSFHGRLRKLRRSLESVGRAISPELVGDP